MSKERLLIIFCYWSDPRSNFNYFWQVCADVLSAKCLICLNSYISMVVLHGGNSRCQAKDLSYSSNPFDFIFLTLPHTFATLFIYYIINVHVDHWLCWCYTRDMWMVCNAISDDSFGCESNLIEADFPSYKRTVTTEVGIALVGMALRDTDLVLRCVISD